MSSTSLTLHPGVSADSTRESVEAVRRTRTRARRRRILLHSGLGLLLFAAFAMRTLLGDYTITIPDFFRIVTGTDIPGASFILKESKLPRAVLGVLAGIGFGVAGAIFQSALRNPLASPDVIGISLGASTLAVLGITVFSLGEAGVSLLAVLGAFAVAVVVVLASGRGPLVRRTQRLVVAGVACAFGCQSVVIYLLERAAIWDASAALRWLTGSLNGVPWSTIGVYAALLVPILLAISWLSWTQPVAELGEDTATALGVPARRTTVLLVCAVLLAGVTVAACGPILFASFLAGPIARALHGGRTTLLGAGLVGGTLVVCADYLAAYAVPDVALPVGVLTGAFGAPFLLWLLVSGRTSRSHL